MKRLQLPTTLFALLCSSLLSAQTQLGTDIDGQAPGDESGHSVSMPDATTIAIGSPLNDDSGNDAGQVRIYEWDGNSWLLKGNPINGDMFGDEAGTTINMPDANTVAIGAIKHDNETGQVKIFSWDGTTWIQKGNDIDGEAPSDWFGWSISMPDENTIGVGTFSNDGNGQSSGHTRIYEWDGTNWVQKGADIDGETADDQSGYSVSMPDANTIAIGARNNDATGNNAGHARIYEWDSNSTTWIQKGNDIDGEAAGDNFGRSVSMPDANTIAISAHKNNSLTGHVQIYEWDGNAWVQRGTDIEGENAGDQAGWMVTMPDVNTVAVSARINDDAGTNAGHVRIFSWDGSDWSQTGSDIDGEAAEDQSGYAISMPDANTIAVSSIFNTDNGTDAGHVRIFSLSSTSNLLNSDQNDNLSIYPNPAINEVNIQSNQKIKTVRLLDLKGQLIKQTNENSISIEELNAGVYLVQVTTTQGVITKKIVKR